MKFSNVSLDSFQAKGDPALEGWEVTVELDQPVTQCVDFNAQMTKISDSIYKFGPKPWNRVVPEGTELQLKLHITWERYRTSRSVTHSRVKLEKTTCQIDSHDEQIS